MAIRSNPLLGWTVGVFAAYWLAGALVPDPYLSSAMSLLLLIFGGVTFMRFADDAFQIVFRGRRNEAAADGDGSHLAAYGVALLSAGSCYVGMFGLLWVYFGQPGHWLGTVYSGFGRGLMAAGFALLFFSPDVTRRGLRLPSGFWVFVVAAVCIVIGIGIGFRIAPPDQVGGWQLAPRDARLPWCPPDRQVVVSQNNVIHPPGSRYLSDIGTPKGCYRTVREARRDGNRMPKS